MLESYTMGSFDTPCVKKVYQLSLSDDPSRIPTDDFERFGYVYKLMDIVQWTTNNDENGTPTYTASATYAGTSTSRYATDTKSPTKLVVAYFHHRGNTSTLK